MKQNPVTLLFFFISALTAVLLSINLILAPHRPYKEKKTPFECGFHSFLNQSRRQFSVIFFVYSILFLIFDLELFFAFPLAVSIGLNDGPGISTVIAFFIILALGFIFELGGNSLDLSTKQVTSNFNFYNSILVKLSLTAIIIFFISFKSIFKILTNNIEYSIYTLFMTSIFTSLVTCLFSILICYYKNSKLDKHKILFKCAFTFITTGIIYFIIHTSYITVSLEINYTNLSLILSKINGLLEWDDIVCGAAKCGTPPPTPPPTPEPSPSPSFSPSSEFNYELNSRREDTPPLPPVPCPTPEPPNTSEDNTMFILNRCGTPPLPPVPTPTPEPTPTPTPSPENHSIYGLMVALIVSITDIFDGKCYMAKPNGNYGYLI